MEKASSGEQQLLQSFQWEQFQNRMGKETFRFGDKHISGLCIEEEIPLVGKYAYCPRGPRLHIASKEIFQEEEMHNLLKEVLGRDCFWLRIEPENKEILEKIQEKLPKEVALVLAPKNIQPQEILVMDISKTEEEIFTAMKAKTRYNIRLAEKKGVHIVETREEKYQNIFFELIQATAKRANIKTHSCEYYRKMFSVFDEKKLQLYVALRENTVLAINMIMIQKDCAIYLHGGSSNEQRNCMAPFLLHWKTIQNMKRRGCIEYDFGGVSLSSKEKITQKKEGGDWEGITRFKTSFCPQEESIKFPGTYDIILNSKRYFFYTLLRKLRHIGK